MVPPSQKFKHIQRARMFHNYRLFSLCMILLFHICGTIVRHRVSQFCTIISGYYNIPHERTFSGGLTIVTDL